MIDYIRTYRQFVSSHHFYEGLRLTIAIIAPVFLGLYLNVLTLGVVTALGVIGVSITDNPGPVHHRINGMKVTIGIMFFMTLITGFSVPYLWLIPAVLALFGFLFSMFGVYGTRATSIGLVGIITMVWSTDQHLAPFEVLRHACFTALGGLWYFILSIGLQQLRPYKLLQQMLGDCIQETAEYLRIKAGFYKTGNQYDASYQALTDAQIALHEKQQNIRELLFKTRTIVKDSTHIGRVLVMAFTQTVDLFEVIMTSHQDYRRLQSSFAGSPVMESFHKTLLVLAEDLDLLGIAYQEGNALVVQDESAEAVKALGQLLKAEIAENETEESKEDYKVLVEIYRRVKDLLAHINLLHTYSSYDEKLPGSEKQAENLNLFVERSDYSFQKVAENLHIQSNIFRHSIRVSIALLTGYAISLWMAVGHSAWILLTIVVILKPAYALTRQRNLERLGGTIAGAIIAALAIYLIPDTKPLVAIVMVFMVVSYSTWRVNYLVMVVFLTAYIILAFHLLKMGETEAIFRDRVLDTAIGSAVSFLLVFLIPPKWERENIRELLAEAFKANSNYLAYIGHAIAGASFIPQQYRLARKDAYVAIANLSDAFQRMLNEPRNKQVNGQYLYQLVVSNHVLASHIATLSGYVYNRSNPYRIREIEALVNHIELRLHEIIQLVEEEDYETRKNLQQFFMLPVNTDQDILDDLNQSIVDDKATPITIREAIITQFEAVLRQTTDIKRAVQKLA